METLTLETLYTLREFNFNVRVLKKNQCQVVLWYVHALREITLEITVYSELYHAKTNQHFESML